MELEVKVFSLLNSPPPPLRLRAPDSFHLVDQAQAAGRPDLALLAEEHEKDGDVGLGRRPGVVMDVMWLGVVMGHGSIDLFTIQHCL